MKYEGERFKLTALDEGCLHLCFDTQGHPVNTFSSQAFQELNEILNLLESSADDIKGLLVSSGKSGFIAGADIKEFAPIFASGEQTVRDFLNHCNGTFNRLESLSFPVVCAISGFALGGGCEFILSCDYRVGDTTASIGLPETKLGIIPGWGGTVRLPRIAGVETAVEWIAAGKHNKAGAVLEAGVLDAVVEPDKLMAAATKTLHNAVNGMLDYRARRLQKTSPLRHNDTELTMAFTTSMGFVAAQAGKHYPAPVSAVKVMQKAAKLSRDEALQVETEAFIKLTQSSEAVALSGLFINDQYIDKKAKTWAKQAGGEISRAAVLGAGIMGGGIAYQSALKKVPVKMKDIAQAGIDLGLKEANKLLAKRVERGRLTPSAAGEVLNRIEPALSFDGFDSVDVVVEAVVENQQVKEKVLAELEQKVGTDTVIASNTSTISISKLAESLQRPENFCGMHFFNPVHAMPLVEVIRGKKTSDAAVATTVAYAKAMGKKAIVVNDCAGFLVNRVLFPYFGGFSALLRDGGDYRQVDKVMEGWGWPMGPAYLLDVVGIDTAVHAESIMADAFPERMSRDFKSEMDWLFDNKHLGQKTGQGFYQYTLDKKGKPKKIVNEDIFKQLATIHTEKSSEFSDEEIIKRLMIPMAIELAHCLEEGIVASPAEADMALIYGIGFPPFRGGVFRWLDSIGLDAFCQWADELAHLGKAYEVTAGMRERKENQQAYYPVPSSELVMGGEK